MAKSRMPVIFCELLKYQMNFIGYLLEDIKRTYNSAKQSISDLKIETNELEEDGNGGYIDYKYYELLELDKLNRIRYGCLSVQISAIAENNLFSLCATAELIKIKVSKTNPNETEIKKCDGNIIDERKLNWGAYERLIKEHKKIEFANLTNFDSVKRFRELSNRFKHSNGRINASFAKNFGGNLGDEIRYEYENWEEMISGSQNFLTDLAGKILL